MEQGQIVTLQLESDYFCAGLDITDGVVTSVAPILYYMLDWTEEKVRTYAKKKGWKVTSVDEI